MEPRTGTSIRRTARAVATSTVAIVASVFMQSVVYGGTLESGLAVGALLSACFVACLWAIENGRSALAEG